MEEFAASKRDLPRTGAQTGSVPAESITTNRSGVDGLEHEASRSPAWPSVASRARRHSDVESERAMGVAQLSLLGVTSPMSSRHLPREP
jgi:hypothetical protein